VAVIRDGLARSVCEFDVEDEDQAFAYAEECMRAASSRLALTNRATESNEAARLAMRAHDVDGVVKCYSDRCEYDDQRRLGGDPIEGLADFRAASERILEQVPPRRMADAGRSR
jgi:hypothetical protein